MRFVIQKRFASFSMRGKKSQYEVAASEAGHRISCDKRLDVCSFVGWFIQFGFNQDAFFVRPFEEAGETNGFAYKARLHCAKLLSSVKGNENGRKKVFISVHTQ